MLFSGTISSGLPRDRFRIPRKVFRQPDPIRIGTCEETLYQHLTLPSRELNLRPSVSAPMSAAASGKHVDNTLGRDGRFELGTVARVNKGQNSVGACERNPSAARDLTASTSHWLRNDYH
jgi:hypothetical protein